MLVKAFSDMRDSRLLLTEEMCLLSFCRGIRAHVRAYASWLPSTELAPALKCAAPCRVGLKPTTPQVSGQTSLGFLPRRVGGSTT